MMGLYNAVFGNNPIAADLLKALGLTANDFERFRDAFVANGEIAVYTRLGGGNRETYPHVFLRMYGHPLFDRVRDDTYDHTYCTFFFDIPPEHAERLKAYDIGPWNPDQRWKDALAKLKSDPHEADRVIRNSNQFVQVRDSSGKTQNLKDAIDALKKTGEST